MTSYGSKSLPFSECLFAIQIDSLFLNSHFSKTSSNFSCGHRCDDKSGDVCPKRVNES